MIIGGLFIDGELTTGIVAQESLASRSVAPYQGILTTNRSNFTAVSSLIEWLEGFGGMPVVWNAPSLIDVRPFQVRKDSRWLTHIRYTRYSFPPKGSMEAVDDLIKLEKKPEELELLTAPGWMALVDSITLWGMKDVQGTVLWGVDPQERGYFLHGHGNVIPILGALTSMHPWPRGSDLSGTESWKKQFNSKLRTIYGMIRTQ